MFFKILKKDLIRKKAMNIIMLLFVLLSSMFMGSSVNNFAASTNAVENFLKLANTADMEAVIAGNEMDLLKADEYFAANSFITAFDRDISIMGAESMIYYESGDLIQLSSSNIGIYIMSNPETYSLIYTTDNTPLTVQDGEMAIPGMIADSLNVKAGDKLIFKYEGYEKEYVISAITKDAGYGTTLSGIGRVIISDNDFKEIEQYFPVKVAFYHIITDDVNAVKNDIAENISGLKTSIDRSTLAMCYIFDVMMAVVMLAVSICLLLIAFMILKFSIVVTLEDDYKEIGVLKALGIKNRSIRRLYLAKYTALSIIGSLIGFIGSIPFGSLLNASLDKNIVTMKTESMLWINIICALFITLIVILYCYKCTSKLNRFSAIEAIRCGSRGESYSLKNKIHLKKTKHLSAPFAMAVNDVSGNLKRYIVMMITFFICLLLIILPMIATDTIESPDVTLGLLGVEEKGMYVHIPTREITMKADRQYLEEYLYDMEEKLSAKGCDAAVSIQAFLSSKITYPDGNSEYGIISIMDLHTSKSTITPIAGSCPEHANEFALSEVSMKEFGAQVGDTYTVSIGDKSFDMILTGTYSNMNNLGKSAHITEKLDVDFSQLSSIMPATVIFREEMTGEELLEAQRIVKETFSEFIVYTDKEYVENFMGTYIDMFNDSGKIVIIISLLIVFLVTLLISRSFVTREASETALLKSIGFSTGSIRRRYMFRIVLCLGVSLVILFIASVPIGNVVISSVFKLFGAYNVKAIINPVYIFLIYPAMILADILLAGYMGTVYIRRIDLKEINNAE